MNRNLEGRLEVVYIDGRCSSNCSYGTFKGERVMVSTVSTANNYLGTNCLVRFSLHQRDIRFYIGNVITPKVPADFKVSPKVFKGRAPEEYILCAIWEEEMRTREFPTLDEFNKYFNPGTTGYIIYLKEDPCMAKKFKILPGKVLSLNCTLGQVIRNHLPDPSIKARVILVESPEQLEKLMAKISKKGLTPIQMEASR